MILAKASTKEIIMKATETNVINFVSGYDKVFLISPFQRNYDWSSIQCEELFNDNLVIQKT